jgi:hypothetical protein
MSFSFLHLVIGIGAIILTSYIFGVTGGKLLGTVEDWSTECDLEVRGHKYNGRKTFYILWYPVRTTGFYHSTGWYGD